MTVNRIAARTCCAVQLAMSASLATGSIDAAAQVTPLRYQLCHEKAQAFNVAHRIETNYRYPPGSALRSFRGYQADRCEPAWVQSPAIFDAIGICPYSVWNGSGGDDPGDWIDYDFHGATFLSDDFMHETEWPQGRDVKVHSALRGKTQSTRHRWWGWSDPPKYAYLGVFESSFTTGANAYPLCYGMAYLVGMFNGVWNTRKDAEKAIHAFKSENFVGQRHQGAPVRYHVFYNQTGCSTSGVACIEDLAEVFIQRSAELDGLLERRWEYFWEQVTGRADAPLSFTERFRSRVLNAAQALGLWMDALSSATLAKITALTARMVASPPTVADTASHVSDLATLGRQGYRAVLVGHSQGSLFASAAYDGYLAHARAEGSAAGQDTGYVAAHIVHVAPASAVLRGPHVLAEIDIIIDGLRHVDGSAVAVNTLSRDVMPPSSADKSGHRLIDTYLDPQRRAREEVKRLLVQSMDAL